MGFCLFRGCLYESTSTLKNRVYEISQELTLAYYFEPEVSHSMNQTAFRLAQAIHAAIDGFRADQVEAKECWIAFCGCKGANARLLHTSIASVALCLF